MANGTIYIFFFFWRPNLFVNLKIFLTPILLKCEGNSATFLLTEEKSSDKDDPSKEMIDCCLYIPNLAFKAIIVFKYIHFVREDTLENTLGSVISQLDAIESILSASSSCKPDSVKLKLTIFIVLCGALSEFRPQKKEKLPKEKEMDSLVEELNDQIVGKSQKYRYLEVGLLRVAKPKSNEPFDEYEKGKLKTFFTNLNDERHKTHDDVENLMSEIVISAPQLKTLEVIQKQLSFQINPGEKWKIICSFSWYFCTLLGVKLAVRNT